MAALAAACPATLLGAQTFGDFTPLADSADPIAPAEEPMPLDLSSPFFMQETIADRTTQNTLSPGSNSGNWDMIVANETGPDAGRYLFMPFETNTAGVQRIDLWETDYNARTVTIVAPGTDSFVSGDMAKWTPWGTFITAEESWGTGSTRGRLFEVTNPLTAAENGGNFVARTILPRVSHEGGNFDSANTFYFVDELNGGSIYKYVSATPDATTGDSYFAAGQTFVLKVGDGGQFEGNNGPAITGSATWVPITDATGGAIAGVSILAADGVSIDGRATADVASILGTGYNRPEDTEYKVLANGNEALFFTTTDSDDNGDTGDGRSRIYMLNLATNEVTLFADSHTLDLATGLEAGGGLRNADNLAIDAQGNIYLIEDRGGGVDDDIWLALDLNHDGDLLDAGEGIGRWASNGTPGSELTGLYFDKFDSTKAYVNIQHPDTGNDRTIMISVVPEPATLTLAGAGLFVVLRRRRRA